LGTDPDGGSSKAKVALSPGPATKRTDRRTIERTANDCIAGIKAVPLETAPPAGRVIIMTFIGEVGVINLKLSN
jgi:hypothetical protein